MWRQWKMYALTDILRVAGGQMMHKEAPTPSEVYFPHCYYGIINGLTES